MCPLPGSSCFSLLHCRYRLAGLPGEHQQRNITSPEVNYCLVTELIIWTQYEIQVAAYNGAGLGVFSRAVTEYTLQGGKLSFPHSCWGAGRAEFACSLLEIKVKSLTVPLGVSEKGITSAGLCSDSGAGLGKGHR